MVKCKNGKCWEDNSLRRKLRSNCDKDDIVCQTDVDLLEEEM